MKNVRILCYGDSNTWGAIVPGKINEYERNENRYTKLLSKNLGKNFEIIEEGLIGRTAGCDDERGIKGNRNGSINFVQHVCSHDPLDYILIMLGTNDLKRFDKSPKEIAKLIEKKYINFVRKELSTTISKTPIFIIVAPPTIESSLFKTAAQKSQKFDLEFENLAAKNNCLFVSNSGVTLGQDGIHMDDNGHKVFAGKIAKTIKADLKNR